MTSQSTQEILNNLKKLKKLKKVKSVKHTFCDEFNKLLKNFLPNHSNEINFAQLKQMIEKDNFESELHKNVWYYCINQTIDKTISKLNQPNLKSIKAKSLIYILSFVERYLCNHKQSQLNINIQRAMKHYLNKINQRIKSDQQFEQFDNFSQINALINPVLTWEGQQTYPILQQTVVEQFVDFVNNDHFFIDWLKN